MPDYESAKSAMAQLTAWYAEHAAQRNEATTRLQLIDRLFFECLGWSRDDVVLEESRGKEYADYTFSAPRRILIVEAKREGDYFELPVGRERLEYSIQSLGRDYPSLKSAIEQVAGYCHTRGVPFAAVANGHQLVAFVAIRTDGLSPFDGKALVFPSLDFMHGNFLDLWQELSKLGLEAKNIQKRLLGTSIPEVPPKLSAGIPFYPGIKDRNIFQTDLQILSDLVLEDLTHSPELEATFLKESYCQSGALSQHALISKTILSARYQALFDSESPGPATVPATTKDGLSPELLAESLSRRPIILIGDVGVGKTTFIRHLIKVEAAPEFKGAIAIYIDLGSKAALSTDLRAFVLGEVAQQLREAHGVDIDERNFVHGVYDSELHRFRKGIYKDYIETNPALFREKEISFLEEKLKNREQHLRESFVHITKARKKQVVIFLDNADQRNDDIQQQAFLVAQEMAEHWPGTVFVALRPETFHKSLKLGTLSGYHPKAFTISPPRVDRVILRRLDFALKFTSGKIPIPALSSSISVNLSKLNAIIRSFLNSLERNNGNNQLTEFIDNLCAGNIRLALDLVRDFFGSGHVDTEKIAEIQEAEEEQGEQGYIVPLHEFLRAVIYGDAAYYDPTQSPIANIFDVAYPDPREHFLLASLLGLLESLSSTALEGGFVETSKIYERLQGLGFSPDQIDAAIIRANRLKLLESPAHRTAEIGGNKPSAFRITTVGVYHTMRLSHLFPYFDAIVVDTPILDDSLREKIHDVQNITDRLNRADIFLHYLDEQWCELHDAETIFDWKAASSNLRGEIAHIRNLPRVKVTT